MSDTQTHLVAWSGDALRTRFGSDGLQTALCGVRVRDTQIAVLSTPSCPRCRAIDAEDARQLTALQEEIR